jgi:hypothetical protein
MVFLMLGLIATIMAPFAIILVASWGLLLLMGIFL